MQLDSCTDFYHHTVESIDYEFGAPLAKRLLFLKTSDTPSIGAGQQDVGAGWRDGKDPAGGSSEVGSQQRSTCIANKPQGSYQRVEGKGYAVPACLGQRER